MDVLERLRDLSFGAMVLRLALAMLCGGAVGYGRSKKERPAGLRTYMLVCLGAAAAVLMSLYLYQMLNGMWAETTAEVGSKFDAARYAAQAVAGIGFIGAGIIIKVSHSQVSGLTTATGLFASVCMGLACGVGFYECVIPVLVIIVLVLNVMSPLEGEFKRKLRNLTLTVEFNDVGDIDTIRWALEGQDAVIYDIDIERPERTENHYASAVFVMKLSKANHSHSGMVTTVAELSCVHGVSEIIA